MHALISHDQHFAAANEEEYPMSTSLLMSKLFNMPAFRRALPETGPDVLQQEKILRHRAEYRRAAVERLFIQIVDCDDADKIGTTISCHSTESSASGLRICSDESIPRGSRIDMWVNISARPGKFFLSADVRWCSQPDNGMYHVGVELIDGSATDTDAWRALHA
jgi:hypothetical protein